MIRKTIYIATPLIAATIIIYTVALFQSINAYETWKQMRLEETPSHLRPFLDFAPYINGRYGVQMILAGALITIGWLTATIFLSKRKLKHA